MKKTMALLLTLILCLGLCACGAAKAPAEPELLPFSPDACAGTYTCKDAVIDGVSMGPGDYTLVLSPDGDSRFYAGEDEYALQEIDWNSGLAAVEDQVYLLTDNGDGTVTMSSEDGAESYVFKLSSLLYEREDAAAAPAAEDAEAAPAVEDAAAEDAAAAPDPLAGYYRLIEMVTGDTTLTEEDLAAMEERGMYSCLIIRSDGSGSLILMDEEWELTDRDVEKQTIRVFGEEMQMLLEEDGTLSLQTAGGDRMRFRLEEGMDPDDPATALDALSKRFWPHKPLKRVGDEQFGTFALPADWTESTEDGRAVYTGDGVTLRLSTIPAGEWDGDLETYFEALADAPDKHGSEMAYRHLSTATARLLLVYLSDYENDLLHIGYVDVNGNLQLLSGECNLDTMSAVCESQSRTTMELRDLICESWRAEP